AARFAQAAQTSRYHNHSVRGSAENRARSLQPSTQKSRLAAASGQWPSLFHAGGGWACAYATSHAVPVCPCLPTLTTRPTTFLRVRFLCVPHRQAQKG